MDILNQLTPNKWKTYPRCCCISDSHRQSQENYKQGAVHHASPESLQSTGEYIREGRAETKLSSSCDWTSVDCGMLCTCMSCQYWRLISWVIWLSIGSFLHRNKKVSGMNATFMKCHWILCLGFKVIGKRYLYWVLVNGISILLFFISWLN